MIFIKKNVHGNKITLIKKTVSMATTSKKSTADLSHGDVFEFMSECVFEEFFVGVGSLGDVEFDRVS
jgi:hypothetical protein